MSDNPEKPQKRKHVLISGKECRNSIRRRGGSQKCNTEKGLIVSNLS